jgi:hypothetical protein
MSDKVRIHREVEIPWTRQATMRRLGRIDTIKQPEGVRAGCLLVRLTLSGRGIWFDGDRLALFSSDSAGDDFRSMVTTVARSIGPGDEGSFYIFDPGTMPGIGDWVWVEER